MFYTSFVDTERIRRESGFEEFEEIIGD